MFHKLDCSDVMVIKWRGSKEGVLENEKCDYYLFREVE